MISLPMAAPFVVLVAAAVTAVLGLRRPSVVIWGVALALLGVCALMLFAFYWQLVRGERPCPDNPTGYELLQK